MTKILRIAQPLRMEPATSIIALCGGHAAVADICGVDVSRVHRWTYPKTRGGTGGAVPVPQQQRLLSGARARGIDLRPEHFFVDLPPVAAASPGMPAADAREVDQSTEVAKSAISDFASGDGPGEGAR